MVDLVAEHPGAEILEIELDWDEPRDPPRRPKRDDATRDDRLRDWRGTRATRPKAARRFDPRWLIGIVAVVFAVWVLSGGDSAEAPAAPAADRSTPTADTTAADLGAQPDPSLDLAANIAGLTQEELVTGWLEVQVDPNEVDKYALLRPVEMIPSELRFAYMGADGYPIVIDLGTGEITSVRTEVRAEGDAGEAVLATSDGALAFAAGNPSEALRFASGVVLVRRHTGELLALVPTDGGVEFGPFVPGQVNERDLLPGSADDVEIVPGVGAFVSARTGGTLEVTPEGLDRITPHEIVATNGTRWLEYRRTDTGDNQMVVTTAAGLDGDEFVLNNDVLDFGLGPAISPDGEWIFLPKGTEFDDFPALYEIETGIILDFEQRVQGLQPVWAPDSSFAAMIDPGRDCIYLFFTSGNNGCISLSRLQIPAIADSRLVVFAPPATSDVASDSRPSTTSD